MKGLVGLRALNLSYTEVTEAGVEELRHALPKAEIAMDWGGIADGASPGPAKSSERVMRDADSCLLRSPCLKGQSPMARRLDQFFLPIAVGASCRLLVLSRVVGASVIGLRVAGTFALDIEGGRLLTGLDSEEVRGFGVGLRKLKANDPGLAVEPEAIMAEPQPDPSNVAKIVDGDRMRPDFYRPPRLMKMNHRLFVSLAE